jgi:hypothetical protein
MEIQCGYLQSVLNHSYEVSPLLFAHVHQLILLEDRAIEAVLVHVGGLQSLLNIFRYCITMTNSYYFCEASVRMMSSCTLCSSNSLTTSMALFTISIE